MRLKGSKAPAEIPKRRLIIAKRDPRTIVVMVANGLPIGSQGKAPDTKRKTSPVQYKIEHPASERYEETRGPESSRNNENQMKAELAS